MLINLPCIAMSIRFLYTQLVRGIVACFSAARVRNGAVLSSSFGVWCGYHRARARNRFHLRQQFWSNSYTAKKTKCCRMNSLRPLFFVFFSLHGTLSLSLCMQWRLTEVVKVEQHSILISALDGEERSVSQSRHFSLAKNTPLPSQRGGGRGCCCLDSGSALEAVEKTFIAPVKNRTMSPRTSIPQPSHYTDQ